MWQNVVVRQWTTVLTLVAALGAARSLAAQQPMEASFPKVDVTDQDDTENRLLKERYNAAVDEWSSLLELQKFGQLTIADEKLQSAMTRVVSSGLELHRRPQERLKLLEQYVRFAKDVEAATEVQRDIGRIPSSERFRARYLRLDAELQLLRETKRMN